MAEVTGPVLPFLRSALRTERDPLLRIVLADALYRSDPDSGGGALLEAMPASPELFLRLRSVGRELGLPVPAVSSLLDLAVDGSPEALARLFALAPLARSDEQLSVLLSDGLVEAGDASPDEMLTALRAVPAPQAQAAAELVGIGLDHAGVDVGKYPLTQALRAAAGGAPAQGIDGWIAALERREVPAVEAVQAASAPAAALVPAVSSAPASPAGVPATPAAAPSSGQSSPAPAAAPPAAPASAPVSPPPPLPAPQQPGAPSAVRAAPAVLTTPADAAKAAACAAGSACRSGTPGGG